MSEEEKTVSIARLAELQRQDDIRKERGEAKNALESYLYQARGKVMEEEEEVDKVSTEEQKQAVLTLVEETEEWLYGDGDEAEASAYFEKERAIVTLSDAIFLRVTESTDRPKAMAKARETLTSTEETTVVWETTKPQITEEERNDVLDRVEKIRKWLSEREDEQSAKAVHEEPAFLSKDIAAQLKPLKTLVDKLGRKPKPAPPKKNDTDSNSTSNESSNGTTVNTTNTTNSTDTADAAEAESDEEMEAMREEL